MHSFAFLLIGVDNFDGLKSVFSFCPKKVMCLDNEKAQMYNVLHVKNGTRGLAELIRDCLEGGTRGKLVCSK